MSRQNGQGRPRRKKGESEEEHSKRVSAWQARQLAQRQSEREQGSESPLVKFARVWETDWGVKR